MVELAFLRSYLAWETFLEESFILYMLGKAPPGGEAARRYSFPPDRKTAVEWVVPEDRSYARWDAQPVGIRAQRFFQDGLPFSDALRSSQAHLSEAKTIRNAVAHNSAKARERFDGLVRTRLGTLPADVTVGSFLGMVVPASAPPISFLEFYLQRIELVAGQIVPV